MTDPADGASLSDGDSRGMAFHTLPGLSGTLCGRRGWDAVALPYRFSAGSAREALPARVPTNLNSLAPVAKVSHGHGHSTVILPSSPFPPGYRVSRRVSHAGPSRWTGGVTRSAATGAACAPAPSSPTYRCAGAHGLGSARLPGWTGMGPTPHTLPAHGNTGGRALPVGHTCST